MPYGRDIQVVGCSRPFFCPSVLWNKFGSNEKSSTFALPFEKRVADEALSSLQDWRMRIRLERFFENFSQKSCRFKKYAYLCSPVRKTGSRKRIWEVHWKDCFTVQEASTEKNTIYREALISLEIISVRTSWEIYIYYTMKSLILAQDER